MSHTIDSATYTTTEKAVGTWTDGKTIYRRVFNQAGTTGTASYSTDTSIRMDTIVSLQALYWYKTSAGEQAFVGPYYSSSTDYVRFFVRHYAQSGASDYIEARVGSGQSQQTTFGFQYILEYTK